MVVSSIKSASVGEKILIIAYFINIIYSIASEVWEDTGSCEPIIKLWLNRNQKLLGLFTLKF